MKARQSTRFKSDTLLIFVALFGIFGGIVVFRSFANPKYDTTKPGSFALRDIKKSGSQNDYAINIKAGLLYCLKSSAPFDYSTEDYQFSVENKSASDIQRNPQKDLTTPLCFSSTKAQSDVVLTIKPAIIPLLSKLEIIQND